MDLNRKHRRAPLIEDALYVNENFVFRAKCLNISEGGILLDSLPNIPEAKNFKILIHMPEIFLFEKLLAEKKVGMRRDFFPLNSLRATVEIVRKFDGISDIDRVFVPRIGCQFKNLNKKKLGLIQSYVMRSKKNIKFLLGLFEEINIHGVNEKEDRFKDLLYLAQLLGYDKNLEPSLIRNKLLSDYQSLY